MKRAAALCRHVNPAVAPAPCSSGEAGGAAAQLAPALRGIRVVELAAVLAAPVCGALLADYGAEVIKIEDPKSPDITRSWGRGNDPAKTADPSVHATWEGGGSQFVMCNRGKKSVALDPTTTEGKALLKQMLGTADIFITNVRLKSLRKAGLDYESLQLEFPKLIYAHLSAFGRAGEMVDDPGYDFGAFWAQTGLMDLCRSSDDAPMPREPGGIGDMNTAMQLLGGIFAALYHRERTGQGQLVDACLLRAGVWSLGNALVSYMGGCPYAHGAPWGLRGSTEEGKRQTLLTKAPLRCKDGAWIQLLGNDVGRHMHKMPALLGVSEDTLYGPDKTRIDWAAACRVADGIFAQRTLKEWEPLLKQHDVWYKPVHKFEDNLDPTSPAHRQTRAVGSFVEAAGVSQHELLASPVQLSAMPARPRAPAPKFGQHTDEVLQELGLAKERLQELKGQGVVAVSRGVRPKRAPRAQ